MTLREPTTIGPELLPSQYEQQLFDHLVLHVAALVPFDSDRYVRGYGVGRRDGYAEGLATAIHLLSGEPVGDIQLAAAEVAGPASVVGRVETGRRR
jgi:hypothetical protein